MPSTPTIKQLFELGAHFGHKRERSFPQARKFTFGVRDGIYIINLEETQRLLKEAKTVVRGWAKEGKVILFVGTKPQAKEAIKNVAQSAGMPYVVAKWLSGMLTNLETVLGSIKQLEALQKEFEETKFTELGAHERRRKESLLEKLRTRFEGLLNLKKAPDALFLVDPSEEKIALQEARTLGIPTMGIVDTNADPDLLTYPIPANDDSKRVITHLLEEIGQAIRGEGKKAVPAQRPPAKKAKTES